MSWATLRHMLGSQQHSHHVHSPAAEQASGRKNLSLKTKRVQHYRHVQSLFCFSSLQAVSQLNFTRDSESPVVEDT